MTVKEEKAIKSCKLLLNGDISLHVLDDDGGTAYAGEVNKLYNDDLETVIQALEQKDKIINLMAEFMNKRSWKEHQVKDDICFCCKIEYSSEECVNCIKQYFEEKVRSKYV